MGALRVLQSAVIAVETARSTAITHAVQTPVRLIQVTEESTLITKHDYAYKPMTGL